MKNFCRALMVATAAVAVALSASLMAQQKDDKPGKEDGKRPRLSLRAQPSVAVAPARIVLTAELVGGTEDLEEFYCPTIEWAWGDDTVSESTVDCEPYESGKSEIKRRFTVQHLFRRAGSYKVYFHMKRKAKTIASASATVQVQPGGLSQPFDER
jgi:hypothetical protein